MKMKIIFCVLFQISFVCGQENLSGIIAKHYNNENGIVHFVIVDKFEKNTILNEIAQAAKNICETHAKSQKVFSSAQSANVPLEILNIIGNDT